ncbi:ricin-type beta-trefoil lectin domain protein [Streptomyces beijiangensis]|uniref:Ricin-type beta-trefoil lectin domain protein n=1 Tax=Streptomyces beijiangensis TaxID=163361 RepID=A0A939JKH5_9ACTN|nr:ricin-type beta-trefoil lectin domain protein [Streptomyces beijiangensis]MBO0515822.1 ricin-type beta-trefoil lectin domain protein [Streptomyces beijiangensis]
MKHRTTPWLRAVLAAVLACTVMLIAGAGAPAAGAAVPAVSESAAGAPGTVTIGGKCLDDADFGTANGTVIQVFTCNGASAQAWTWGTDGSVTVYGKCLDVTGASNANGALVQLYSCVSGVPQQKFKYLPDGTIYSVKSGKCLAVQGGSVVNSARIGLAPCDPAQPTQKWGATTAPAAKYSLSSGKAVSYARPDDTPASVYNDKDGTFYYTQAHALYGADETRKWSFYTGANFDSTALSPISGAVNPANPDDRNDDTTWRCNNSPTGLESTAAAGSGYSQRNYCDLSGVWVDPDSGNWYGLVHNEFTPQPFGDGMHYDSIDFAVSTNQGKTWNIQDHAITSPFSTARNDTAQFPGSTYYYGDGDQRLFVDNASGYFYVFYASRVLNKSGGGAVWLQHVARAPIAQKMARSSWKKWYDGAWQTPGVGGAESDIIPSEGLGSGYIAPADDYRPGATGKAQDQVSSGTLPDHSQLTVMNIAWNAYLGKYIGTPQNNIAQNTDTKTPLHFYATDDLATQKWEDMGSVADQPNAAWYRWFLDTGNLTSSTVLGKTFRSYCSFYCSTYSGEYADITIAPKSASALPVAPVNGTSSYQLKSADGTALAQKWKFTATGDGFFTVSDPRTGKALGVAGGNTGRAWGAAVTPGTLGTTPSAGRQWSFQPVVRTPGTSGASTATGTYRLINRYSGLALSIGGSGAAVTSPQRGWDNTGSIPGGDTSSAAAQLLTFTS